MARVYRQRDSTRDPRRDKRKFQTAWQTSRGLGHTQTIILSIVVNVRIINTTMAWCSSCVLPLLLAIVVQQAVAADRLRVAYEWKQIDFAYRTAGDRQAAIEDGTFVPENVIPVGVERHEQRLFVTLPRWKTGVPASLAYIDMNGECFDVCVLCV